MLYMSQSMSLIFLRCKDIVFKQNAEYISVKDFFLPKIYQISSVSSEIFP